jgi:hypothetical protein
VARKRPLHGDGFENVRASRERSRAHQAQAGRIEQLRELCLGALAATRVRSMIRSSRAAETIGPLDVMRSGRSNLMIASRAA